MAETFAFGTYEGEPGGIEILQRKAFRTMYGVNRLAINHQCPACGTMKNAEWIRQQWVICYDCEIAFDSFERYTDLTECDNPDEEYEMEE